MKKIATVMSIALIFLGSLPVFAAVDPLAENAFFTNSNSFYGNYYRVSGNYRHTFTRFVNRGHVDILISGDGSTDLDLYVYIGDDIISSDGNSDDEKVCLGRITRSGTIKIVVINRGSYPNDYQLIIK